MRPSGLKEVDKQARTMGAGTRHMNLRAKPEPPFDFLAALAANAEAERAFTTLDRANRYAFIYRVNDCKRPERGISEFASFVTMLLGAKPSIQPKTAKPRAQRRSGSPSPPWRLSLPGDPSAFHRQHVSGPVRRPQTEGPQRM